MSTTYVPQTVLASVALEIQENFEFNLHSQSTIAEIAQTAQSVFDDMGLRPRRSAVVATAKMAKAIFAGTINATKKEINQ